MEEQTNISKMRTERPTSEGLYNQEFEHGSCGIGFVAHIHGRKSHSIITMGLATSSGI